MTGAVIECKCRPHLLTHSQSGIKGEKLGNQKKTVCRKQLIPTAGFSSGEIVILHYFKSVLMSDSTT